MRRPGLRASAVLLLLLATVAGLAGCGRSEERQLADVRALTARHEYSAAVISAKSLIQSHPKSAEARLLLGSLLLDGGEPALAEIELQRALELRSPEVKVAPLLARAMLNAGQARRVVAQYHGTRLPDAQASAALMTTVAQAQAATGDLIAATDTVARVLALMPRHEPALLLQLRLKAAGGDSPAARSLLDALLETHPASAEAWVLKGDWSARSPAGLADAMAAWRQALQYRPDHVRAHAALVSAHLALRDTDAARLQFEAMRKVLPKHPQTRLFEGQLAFLAGDLAKARGLFQGLLRGQPDNLMLLQSAGAVELRLNAPAQAERLLVKALQIAPEVAPTRRLLAQSYLSLGQADRALAVLEPLLEAGRNDAEALTLAAQARLMSGDAKAAELLFNRVARLKPDDPAVRTALALAHLSRGQVDKTVAELQSVSASDKGITADLALISTQLRANAHAAALKAVDALERKQPDKPLAAYLRGQVQLARKDRAAARQAFEQALSRDASYLPAVNALAGLDLGDHQPEAARARFDALVKADPQNSAARLGQAELARRAGADREAVASLLEAAVKASPASVTPRLALIDHHLASYNAKAALVASQAGLALLPDDVDLLFRLGRSQLRLGEPQQAIASFSRVVALQPRSEPGQLALVEAQIAGRDLSAASRTLQRALEQTPHALPLLRQAIDLAMLQKQPQRALVLARGVQAQRPSEAAGFLLEGEVELAGRHWDAAVAVLRKAVARSDPGHAPERLHQALRVGGKPDEADAFALTWARDHVQDAMFRFYLGDLALAAKDFAAAQRHYESVLALQPGQALALNNVAWLLMQQKRPGALDFAERAVKAAPDRPALLDTLAMVHAAEGRADKAIALQKRALQLLPADPLLRLNLARFLLQAGEKREAKAELDRLDQLGDRFNRRDEVQAMLKVLARR